MISRDLGALDSTRFDIAIVGGGIHGAALALDSARRGLRVALVEKHDFGSSSSGNSLRILHGGLRYLQTLDLMRFRESVAARKCYAQQFPQLVRPLPCVMPLYGHGTRRPSVMRIALAMNDLLSMARNNGLASDIELPTGRILSRTETLGLFPAVRSQGLVGAALWYDYQMISSERILIEMLRDASNRGAVIANYTEATRYVVAKNRIAGVVCVDQISGRELFVEAGAVVNCAGPACSDLASRAGCATAHFAPPSVAFNVLFDSQPMSSHAVAVAAPQSGAPMHFICPSRHGLLAGTAHLSRNKDSSFPASPTESEVEQFVSALKQAVPAFSWSSSLIRKVYWGVLPVKRESTVDLTVRPEIVPHGKEAVGLYSVVGIKFTTAMQVATTALQMIFGSALPQTLVDKEDHSGPALSKFTAALLDGDRAIELSRSELLQIIRTVAKDEAVFETDDLFLRRTNWLFTAKEPQLLHALVDEALLQISRFTPAPMSQTQNTSGVH